MDVAVQQQAALEGALWRITLRQLAGPIIASVAVVTLLATQEFSVYEPTGISVVATEVRMVFETGAFSGTAASPAAAPATAPAGATAPARTPALAGAATSGDFPTQSARSASAVATALPLLLVTMLLAGVALAGSAKADYGEQVTVGDAPRALQTPQWAGIATATLALVTLGVPIISLLLAMRVPLSPTRVWIEFGPELTGALFIAAATALLALALSFTAVAVWLRGSLLLAGLSFLIGGQLLAIAMIRIWNRPQFTWLYDNYPVPVMAYVGRFGWLALAAARGSWTARWDELRAMAALDGAGVLRTAIWVLWPLVWPSLLAAALLAGALSMTEVPATVLLQPQNPQVLTPMLMTWVHIIRYDPMIEASLLMMAMVLIPTVAAVALWSLSQHLSGRVPAANSSRSASASRREQ
jgi:ABC-type Fe3+ transport system permease subunit